MERLALSAGVRLRYYTRLVGVEMRAGNTIAAVVTESKSGREVWPAAVFVDATGDGDLGALAGCGFDIGRSDSGATQPMSLQALITGVREEEILSADAPTPRKKLIEELKQAGFETSASGPGLTRLGPGLFKLSTHHAYTGTGLDADALTRATVEGRAELAGAVRALRQLGGPRRNVELAATSPLIGVREGRRLHGLYTVTRDDLIAGRRHADAVCRVMFPVDVHSTDPKTHQGYSNEGVTMQPYDIPLRALIARDVTNLTMAGRCISGDFYAHASYRVVGNAFATGEAAGLVAVRAALTHRAPADVPFAELQEHLI